MEFTCRHMKNHGGMWIIREERSGTIDLKRRSEISRLRSNNRGGVFVDGTMVLSKKDYYVISPGCSNLLL